MLGKDDAKEERDDVDASSASVIWHKTNLIRYLNVSIETDKLRHFCGWCAHNCVRKKRKQTRKCTCQVRIEIRIGFGIQERYLDFKWVVHSISLESNKKRINNGNNNTHSLTCIRIRRTQKQSSGENDRTEWKRIRKYTHTQTFMDLMNGPHSCSPYKKPSSKGTIDQYNSNYCCFFKPTKER